MRHRNAGRQFGRNSSHRKALFRNLVTSLFEHDRIETTEAKAKEIRGIAERMITLAKKGDLHAKRQAMSYIRSRDVVARLFDNIAPRVENRPGGYMRIIKTRVRLGDSAPMAVIELVDKEGTVAPAPKQAARKKAAAAVAPAAPATDEAAPAPEEAAAETTEEAGAEEPKAEDTAEAAGAPEASEEDKKE